MDPFSESKINKLDVASIFFGYHDVFWFEIPIHNVAQMKVLQRLNDFCNIESHVLSNNMILFKDVQALSFYVFEFIVQISVILKSAVNIQNKRTFIRLALQLEQDFSFRYGMINMFHFQYSVLRNDL